MPLNIKYEDFDTVCYSTQHNIIELIKKSVGIGIQVDINTGDIFNTKMDIEGITQQLQDVKDELDKAQQEGEDNAVNLNSLVLRVNALERDLSKLRSEYDLFSLAVAGDIDSISRRVAALEGRT